MTRRTIKETFRRDYGGFCGWGTIEETVNRISEPETQAIFNGIFQLGCRAMELPTLTRRQVDLRSSDTHIWVRGMLVEKQREKIFLTSLAGDPIFDEKGRREFKLVSKRDYRTFPIRRDNPTAGIFEEYVKEFTRDEELFPYSYNQIYYRITTIGMRLPPGVIRSKWAYHKGPWWPHRLRAERACQLIRDLRYDLFRLKRWFGWSTGEMAELYGDLEPTDLIDNRDVDWR